MTDEPEVFFKEGEDYEFEAIQREYRSDIVVRFRDGRQFDLSVFTPRRIAQELARKIELNEPYFAEPSMIVLADVKNKSIVLAVKALALEGFFDELLPSTSTLPN
jgi:hypothetical protein